MDGEYPFFRRFLTEGIKKRQESNALLTEFSIFWGPNSKTFLSVFENN